MVFGMERFNQYVYRKEVEVESDHKPLEAIMLKPLCHAPPRLQRMLLRLQKYDFKLKYKPGKEMLIADTLSRACIKDTTTDRMEEELSCAVNLVMNNSSVSDVWLQEIKETTTKDQSMQMIRNLIQFGWPEKQSQVPKEIQEYWNIRDQLSEVDGILLKGEKLIIPNALRNSMIKRIHMGHMKIVKCSQRAREVMFWPGMNKAIEHTIANCDVCQEHRDSNPKEPMLPGPMPERPWEIVATDLFQWSGRDYLLMVYYYSRFIEVKLLENTSSSTVVHHTKSILARHGIPNVIVSDNGPQFTAKEYQKFTREWGVQHTTSSPYYPQSNGLAEKSVQIIKKMWNKACADKQDLYLCLLAYRNTVIDNLASPAQLLMGRRLRSNLPVVSSQLQPEVVHPELVKLKLKENKQTQKRYYDIGSRSLPPIQKREKARVQIQGKWEPVVVINDAKTPRSYIVRTESGKILRRNRKHLMKLQEQELEVEDVPTASNTSGEEVNQREAEVTDQRDTEPTGQETDQQDQMGVSTAEDPPQAPALKLTTTRYGRVSKPPNRYQDFIQF